MNGRVERDEGDEIDEVTSELVPERVNGNQLKRATQQGARMIECKRNAVPMKTTGEMESNGRLNEWKLTENEVKVNERSDERGMNEVNPTKEGTVSD